MLLCFPIVLLSQLDISSMWAVVSPKVLRSMVRCPFSWLTIYVESAAITAVCLASAYAGSLWLLVFVSMAGAAALRTIARSPRVAVGRGSIMPQPAVAA